MSELSTTIAAQADAIAPVLSMSLDEALAALEPSRRIWLVGTGTSEHAAQLGAWMFAAGEREVRASSCAAFACLRPRLRADDGVVVLSHTTQTAYARTARAYAGASDAALVTITGRGRGWPEAIETVAPETSETYTASYTAALLVLARLAVGLRAAAFGEPDLSELPDRVAAASRETTIPGEVPARLVVLAGVGPAAVTAREGALKLREAARILAEGYEAEYLLHGSAVPLAMSDVLLALEPPQDTSGLLAELVRAAGAEGLTTGFVREPPGLSAVLAQIPLTVRLQTVAAALAAARGVDPDRVIVGHWANADLWAAGAPAS